MSIVATGRMGSIGKGLPADVIGLKSRLEWSVAVMVEELRAISATPTAFIHLAALSDVKECEANPEKAIEMNADGAVRWLRAAAEVGCKRFVHVSTSHVFKATSKPEILEPTRTPDATSAYGVSKVRAEDQLEKWAKELDVELVITRVFSVVGRGMRPGYLYADLERRVRERDFSPLPGYKNVRDFVDVETICARLITLAEKPSPCQGVFHICSGNPMTVRELAQKVLRENGVALEEAQTMFPENRDEPNYMISKPSEI